MGESFDSLNLLFKQLEEQAKRPVVRKKHKCKKCGAPEQERICSYCGSLLEQT